MHSKTPIIVAACAVALIAVATLLWNRREPTPAASPDPTTVEGARAGTDAPSLPPAPQSDALHDLSPAAQAAISGIVSRRLADQGERRQAAARTWENVHRAYRSEQRDAAWAPGKERELRAIAGSEALESAGVTPATGLQISCRQSLCESVAEFASASAAQDWLLGFMASMGSASTRSAVRQETLPGGGMRVRIVSEAR